MWVGGHAEPRVEPVEGLLGLADGVPLGVAVVELAGQVGVVTVMEQVQVAAEVAGELLHRPVAELMTAGGGWGLQVRQQLVPALGDKAVGGWWAGWGGV